MAVRSLEQLRWEQERLLEGYRSGRTRHGSVSSMDSAAATRYRIGKVTSVVPSDETYGAHLVVKPQVFSGRPPASSNSSEPTRIAYPTPNLTVGNYTVGEYVALWLAKGGEFAVKLEAGRYFGERQELSGRGPGWDQYVTV